MLETRSGFHLSEMADDDEISSAAAIDGPLI